MAAKRGEVEDIGNPAPPWYWSLVGLVYLLVAFFMAMVAKTDLMKQKETNALSEKIQEISDAITKERSDIAKDSIQVHYDAERGGLVVTLAEKVLYEIGKAELGIEAKVVLDKLAPVFQNRIYQVIVEGHTDDVPIKTPQFPTNWELSTARAVSVLRYLIETHSFSPERISARGCGEFHPVVPNVSEDTRAKNRRVDFIITSTEETAVD